MIIEIFADLLQGSPEWLSARAGLPTCSEFSTIMAKGKGGGESKTRRTYMLKLIGEQMTGEVVDSYTNGHMERGKVMEEEARQLYAMAQDVEVVQVGFIKNGVAGYSPDGLISDDGATEIKTKLPHLHLDVLLRGEVPSEHIHQCQGGLWVSQREWIDFVSYWTGLPIFIKRMYRDEKLIAEIKIAVDQFLSEMHELMEKIKSL